MIPNVFSMVPRSDVVNALVQLRLEWQQATAGQSLLRARASVGLLLADIATAIDLTPEEQQIAFGDELLGELRAELAPGD